MLKRYVSIITPCYNREKILYRFLDSVLQQSYKKIHMIMIDDGSSDNTLSVIKSYKSKFESNGMLYEFYSKKNGGVSSAINEGLKYVKGEFLCWPDSDDWYATEAIKTRVDFLNKHPDYGIVTCDADIYYEDNPSIVKGYVSGKAKERFDEHQFKHMLEGKTLVCPICHMVRTNAFFATHPKRKIYDSRHGQNIQMLLPIYYSYKRGFIDEALCHYMVIANSLSRRDDTFEKKMDYRNAIETLMIETLNDIEMPNVEREKYIAFTKMKNTRRRLNLAVQFNKVDCAKEQLRALKQMKALGIKDLINYMKLLKL